MSCQREIINLAFICDDNYALCTGVAIASLKRNRNVDRQYGVYIVADRISEQNRHLFQELEDENFGVEIICAEKIADYSNFKKMKYAGHVSSTALYKFNLPDILPSLDKVLYMDGDIIIRDSLEELFDMDVSEHYVAACKDIGAETWPSHYNERLGINHSAYFNSGVMLLNLKKLREENIPNRLIEYKKNGINHYMDQDAFNVVFEEKVRYISFLYNMAISCWRDRDNTVLCSHYDLGDCANEKIYRDAKVIHFSAPEKPWLYSNAIGAEEWLINFINSPFRRIELHRTLFTKKQLLTNGCTMEQISLTQTNATEITPLISVVIPVYNASKFLRECVESLLCQTFSDAEFIFIDDGSSDDSVMILQHYAKLDPRVRVFQQQNQRAGIARNNGMSRARGEFITFLDSDDMMLPDALEIFYNRAVETGTDIVISSAYHFANDVNKRQEAGWCLRKEHLPEEEIFSVDTHAKKLFQVTAGAPWGKFYKTSLIQENNLCFPSMPRGEDLYFVYWALAVAKSITTTDEKTVLYRILPGSGSLEDIKDKFPTAQVDSRELLWEKLNEIGVYEKVKQSFLNGTINGLAYHFNGFKTMEASRALYNAFKDRMVPLYKLDMSDPSYYYTYGEYRCVKEVYDSKDFEDYSFKRYKKTKGDADYFYREMKKAQGELEEKVKSGASYENISSNLSWELAVCKSELQEIKNSYSYKIGRFITFIPRKIRGGIRCYQEHGMRYTLERFLVHLHIKEDPYK